MRTSGDCGSAILAHPEVNSNSTDAKRAVDIGKCTDLIFMRIKSKNVPAQVFVLRNALQLLPDISGSNGDIPGFALLAFKRNVLQESF